MSSCDIFSSTFSATAKDSSLWKTEIGWLKSFIGEFKKESSGVWQPIVIKQDKSGPVEYGKLLSAPYNSNDTNIAPCQCKANPVRGARNIQKKYIIFGEDIAIEPEDGIFCNYCELIRTEEPKYNNCTVSINYKPKEPGVPNAVLTWPINDQGNPQVFTPPCCEGGCDTRALTDDLAPKIPYLYTNYHTKFRDFKYHQQFPSITNPGLGYEKFAKYNGTYNNVTINNMSLNIDWTLEPRLGEIPAPSTNTDTYHLNIYSHKKSYKNYLISNKTCGNFILTQVNTSTSIAALQSTKMVRISGINMGSGVKEYNGTLDTVIPPVDKFTIPYGIKDNTHWNIFLKQPFNKEGGLWKWNISSGILGWYRYYDKDRLNDVRPIPGVDLYISEGDVFYATNDGPEPNAIAGGDGNCEPKVCPSGLKLSNYTLIEGGGEITVLPSGSEFIYISCNLYDKVYSIMNKITTIYKNNTDLPNLKYKDLLSMAAILATGPQFDGITVDLFSAKPSYNEDQKIEFMTTINKRPDAPKEPIKLASINAYLAETPKIDTYGRDSNTLNKLTNKLMVSYNDLNIITDSTGLVNTLMHKYGGYLWLGPKSQGTITINKKVNAHIGIDINFEPVVKKSDTYNIMSGPVKKLTCDSVIKGNTKIFGYDQNFKIGNASIRSQILDTKPAYNTICEGNPPRSTVYSIVNTMSIYANKERVFSESIGESSTRFVDAYSRFPSVSSTFPAVSVPDFSELVTQTDEYFDDGVYSVANDKQLRLYRRYNALAAHPAIDLVAFHQDGGFFYDSILLNKYPGTGTVAFIKGHTHSKSKSEPQITFSTYDVGLKIYDIELYKLRDPNNMSCNTMPIDQSCKCWNLEIVNGYPFKCGDGGFQIETPNLYTPFLSTASNPATAYGGYPESKVKELLGDFTIPGHPAPMQKLNNADRSITLNNVKGCKYTASITLSTYINATWQIRLPDWDTDSADIWVSFSEQDSFYGSRNGTKITINGTEIHANSQVNLGKIGRNLTILVTNIFLDTVFGDLHPNLYHPNIFPCSYERSISVIGGTPTRTINVTFGVIPENTKVVFSLPPIQSIGTFKVATFDPNSGLIENTNEGSCLTLKNNGMFNFRYDDRLFTNSVSYDTQHKVYFGEIDISRALKHNGLLDLLSHSKKTRLYIKHNNSWYEYGDHRAFGYYNPNEEKQYCGWPTTFSEYRLTHTENTIGNIIPAIPKVPLEYVYMPFVNKTKKTNIGDKTYPILDLFFIRDRTAKNTIYIEGSRAYFALINKNDFFSNEDLLSYSDDQYVNYDLGVQPMSMSVILTNKNTTDTKDSDAFESTFYNTIIEKSITVNLLIFTTGSINLPIANDIYNNIFTKLKLKKDIDIPFGTLHINTQDSNLINLTAFATVPIENSTNLNTLININSGKDQTSSSKTINLQNYVSSKWSDKYYFSSYDILNSQFIENQIKKVYNPYIYSNTLSQLISNNLYESDYSIGPTGNSILKASANWHISMYSGYNPPVTHTTNIKLTGIKMNHYIHRPFSLGRNDRYPNSASKFNLFKNENGLIDINILDSNSVLEDTLIDKLKLKDNDKNYDYGVLRISGVYRPTYISPPTGLRSDKIKLFIDLDPKFLLKPVPISPNASIVYSDTFVINNPYDVFAGASISTNIDQNVDLSECEKLIFPNIGIPPSIDSSTIFNWGKFSKETTFGEPYAFYSILCDKDTGTECSKGILSITQVGSLAIRSRFHNYTYQYANIGVLGDSIEIGLSVDAGLYNSLGNTGSIPYISRASFSNTPIIPNSNLLGNTQCMNGQTSIPAQYDFTVWDGVFQTEIANNLVDRLNIDIWANELIFRTLYGSREKIGLNNISKKSSSNVINRDSIINDLVNKNKASLESLYDSIPMDYDSSATPNNLKLSGNIRILGKGAVGDSIKFYFNDELFTIKISETEEAVIAECPEIGAKGLLYEKFIKTTSFFLREAGTEASSIIGDNVTENIVGSCRTASSSSVSAQCVCDGNGDGGYTQNLIPMCFPAGCYVGCADTVNDFYPGPLPGSFPTFSIPPCSAFPIKEKNSNNSDGPIDDGWTRYGISTGFNAPVGVETIGFECGNWSASVGKGTSCCTDSSGEQLNNGRSIVTYRIKDCHYDFTLKGVIENSIHKSTSLNFVNPSPIGCNSFPTQIVDDSPVAPRLCDCNNPDGDCSIYPNGVPFFNCELAAEKCTDPEWGEDCTFGPYNAGGDGGCCQKFCQGSSFAPRECLCLWIDSEIQGSEEYVVTGSSTPGTKWEVVETNTVTPSPSAYTAGCDKFIANIIYDNTELRINLGSAQTKNGVVIYNGGNCSKKDIRECPKIKIVFPDGTYTAYHIQDSTCTECKHQKNIIEITESPTFDLITETRYCILGTYSYIVPMGANLTTGFPCGDKANTITSNGYVPNTTLPGQPHYISSRIRTCGKPLDSYNIGSTSYSAWYYFLPSPITAKEGLQKPDKSQCSTVPYISNAALVYANLYMSNSEAKDAAINGWKSTMSEVFLGKSFCFNSDVKIDDIIEGAVPGTCNLKFAEVSWPVWAVRNKRSLNGDFGWDYDSEVSETSANAIVAYISYKYKRPVSITDKFIEKFADEEVRSTCSTFFGSAPKNHGCPGIGYNMKEIYKSTESRDSNCISNPTCYDTTKGCASDYYCCQYKGNNGEDLISGG